MIHQHQHQHQHQHRFIAGWPAALGFIGRTNTRQPARRGSVRSVRNSILVRPVSGSSTCGELTGSQAWKIGSLRRRPECDPTLLHHAVGRRYQKGPADGGDPKTPSPPLCTRQRVVCLCTGIWVNVRHSSKHNPSPPRSPFTQQNTSHARTCNTLVTRRALHLHTVVCPLCVDRNRSLNLAVYHTKHKLSKAFSHGFGATAWFFGHKHVPFVMN